MSVRKIPAILIPAVLACLLGVLMPSCEKYVLPDVQLSVDTLWFGAKADSLIIGVTTNVITTAKSENQGYWLMADPDWFEESCDVIVYVGQNSTKSTRTGTLDFKSEAIQRTLVVIQEGAPETPEE